MRLFIAINFTDEVKDMLYQTILKLRNQSISGNFSRKENMHLTLAFLGEVSESHVNDIKTAMDKIDKNSFNLEISGLGNFRNRGEKLYWIGVENNPDLSGAHEVLTDVLKKYGIAFDDKPFKPHITLGRRCVMKDDFSESDFRKNVVDISMIVSAISLMKSEQIYGKLKYSEIYKTTLK